MVPSIAFSEQEKKCMQCKQNEVSDDDIDDANQLLTLEELKRGFFVVFHAHVVVLVLAVFLQVFGVPEYTS